MIKNFLHTGFEVDNLEQAIELYSGLGFSLEKQFEKPEPQALAAQMSSPSGTGVELWQFIDKEHPQVEFIRQHVAVESDDLEGDINELVAAGCEVVIPITNGVTLTYAFVRDPSGNYIEVAQR